MRRVSAGDGIITTVADTGERSDGGDGKLATQAQLDRPNGVAVDAQGNLYIADTDNHRVRKVSGAGIITTVAGTGEYGGDGKLAAQAQLSVQLIGLDEATVTAVVSSTSPPPGVAWWVRGEVPVQERPPPTRPLIAGGAVRRFPGRSRGSSDWWRGRGIRRGTARGRPGRAAAR